MRDMTLKLVVANKAYSSWSLRPWILLAHFKIPFEEVVIPMDQPETRAAMLKYAPTGKCPSLHDGAIAVWESLAIMDYVAETFRRRRSGRGARRRARTRARSPPRCMPASRRCARHARPTSAASRRRSRSATKSAPTSRGSRRPGRMRARRSAGRGRSCSDASPPPTRCSLRSSTASTPTTSRSAKTTRAYMEAMMALPAWKAWIADAEAEPWRIERYEAL